ncbi:ATP-binding protein [Silvibacterium acidisoli]|uniref:ATP-binding protein n=1 Tax=Acidobacteriaceae bacterium ZG23-2 TaxID=2883246 RepID=UPI00406CF5DE
MKLFPRIFFSFWIATLLMIGLVLIVGNLLPPTFLDRHDKRFAPESVTPMVNRMVNDYEIQGRAALSRDILDLPSPHRKAFYLFDQQGSPIYAQTGDYAFFAALAQEVLSSGHSEFIAFGMRMLYACPVTSATGHRYVAVFTITVPFSRIVNLRFWFNIALAMVPAAFVAFLLTLYITRPIIRLQNAAKRLADGDLHARAGPLRLKRRNDELADLAAGFDVMAARIQSLMTAQKRFVADVSHELGAPLTRMHLALALLRREFPVEERSALNRIERETDKLSNLVQQLLLLASLEAGSVPAESLALVSIRVLCDSILEDAELEAAHAGQSLTGNREDIEILVFPNLLRRAIDNILRNALRYAHQGSEIELHCHVDREAGRVAIEVADRGPGVPEAMLRDIFRAFFRTAPGRETASGGTGLGLAIAAEAARMHGGSIVARNREHGGLSVVLTIPIRFSPSEAAEEDGPLSM